VAPGLACEERKGRLDYLEHKKKKQASAAGQPLQGPPADGR
jgi:hypothetical protein